MKKISIIGLALLLVVTMVAGCTTKATEPVEPTANEATEQPVEEVAQEAMISGEVTVSGSTSVEKIGIALGAEFMAMYPDVKFTYQGIGSSAGVKNANEGVTMIGTASRNIKDSEKEFGLTEQVLAFDGIAVIVNPAISVDGLTKEQVQKIFIGEITNWSQVGGADKPVVVVSREDGSGTRGAFEEIVDYEDMLSAKALIAEGNGNVQSTVATNPNAVGYVSFTYIDETVKPVTIDGGEPTVASVLDGSYPISRPFNIIYHEDNLSDAAIAWLEFVTSDLAKEIIAEKGGIPID